MVCKVPSGLNTFQTLNTWNGWHSPDSLLSQNVVGLLKQTKTSATSKSVCLPTPLCWTMATISIASTTCSALKQVVATTIRLCLSLTLPTRSTTTASFRVVQMLHVWVVASNFWLKVLNSLLPIAVRVLRLACFGPVRRLPKVLLTTTTNGGALKKTLPTLANMLWFARHNLMVL